MKKYKLVNGRNYSHFIEGEVYNEDVVLGSRGVSVEQLVGEYPNNWEEVVEQPIKNFKFVGSYQEAGKYAYPVRVGMVYPDDYFKNIDSAVDLISEFTWSADDWEEVTEELVSPPKIFTDAEVVTLVTFLNDNFEELEKFIHTNYYHGGLSVSFYYDLEGHRHEQAPLLIDKIEKNDINLTEAEKVTIITFLNDNFEEFEAFLEEYEEEGDGFNSEFVLGWDIWNELKGYTSDKKVALLIDKIEKS